MELSHLQKARYAYKPKLPPILESDLAKIAPKSGAATESVADHDAVKAMFVKTYGKPIISFEPGKAGADVKRPLRVGVILSGGQAPGGHNVITGIFDGLKKANKDSVLFGFLGGPAGIMNDKYVELDGKTIDAFRNTGGFDMIGSGRDKIEKPEQFAAALKNAQTLKLDAIVVIGGDDSNTNAALLAEDFLSKGSTIQVLGVPKTIDGDLKNEYIETSFGFDTACKTYGELIGNIMRDCKSAKKYWHFVKLMGRSASHIGLECALQTHPNVCLISEEVEQKKLSLAAIVDSIADVVASRAANGLNFGVALIPEGLVEFVPEMKALIKELNEVLAEGSEHSHTFARLSKPEEKAEFIRSQLGKAGLAAFDTLPKGIQAQLLLDRDPHGNVQVSLIETEKLLAELVKENLDQRRAGGSYKGKFSPIYHFFGYEGRCAFPSNFDADYCYSLGYNAAILVANGLTGYLSSIRNLHRPAKEWKAGGIPLTMMMNMETRHGQKKAVIRKALVELNEKPFKEFASHRDSWALVDDYVYPGAIQYFGPSEVCDQPSRTLVLERGK